MLSAAINKTFPFLQIRLLFLELERRIHNILRMEYKDDRVTRNCIFLISGIVFVKNNIDVIEMMSKKAYS